MLPTLAAVGGMCLTTVVDIPLPNPTTLVTGALAAGGTWATQWWAKRRKRKRGRVVSDLYGGLFEPLRRRRRQGAWRMLPDPASASWS
jgi:hypothetical protein